MPVPTEQLEQAEGGRWWSLGLARGSECHSASGQAEASRQYYSLQFWQESNRQLLVSHGAPWSLEALCQWMEPAAQSCRLHAYVPSNPMHYPTFFRD